MLLVFDNLTTQVGWGRYSWGFGPWGDEPNNVLVVEGVQGTSHLGTARAVSTVSVSGFGVTGYLGDTATVGAAVVSVSGHLGTGVLGNAAVAAAANVTILGLTLMGDLGSVLIWGQLDDSQTANWVELPHSQTVNWSSMVT